MGTPGYSPIAPASETPETRRLKGRSVAMTQVHAVRQHLARVLDWRDAHATFDDAVADLPPEHRGVAPAGLPYSPWQLLEHIRLTQADILAFCARPDYREGKWPDDVWPPTQAPPDELAWEASIAAYHRDLAQLRATIDALGHAEPDDLPDEAVDGLVDIYRRWRQG